MATRRNAQAALAAAILAVACPAAPAGADGPASGDGAAGGPAARLIRHLGESPRLLGDPGGARSRLEQLGIGFQLFFNDYLGGKVRGGRNPDDAIANSASYDFFTLVDMESLGVVEGLAMLLHVKGNHGRNVNPDVGALSDPIDDADGDWPIYVAEAWAEQSLLQERFRIRLGYLDQQTVFDRNAFANSEDKQFMSTFLDNNPIVPLKIGLGATLLLDPVEWLELAIGTADADNVPRRLGFDTAFDGVDSLMGYLEIGFKVRGRLPGTYRLGAVWDATQRPVFGSLDPATGHPSLERGHPAAYLSFDQLVFREGPQDTQGLGLFARYGAADGDVNRIAQFWSLGLQYLGALPGRDADVLGIGMYQALGSSRYRREVDPSFDRETGVELYYRIALLPWFALTPDVQYIAAPGGARPSRDAVVLVLRARLTF
jgi:porin